MHAVVVIESDPRFAEKLASLLPASEFTLYPVSTLGEGAACARQTGAVVAIAGPTLAFEDVLVHASGFGTDDAPVAVIAVTGSVDTETMRRAMHAGLHDVVSAVDQTWAEVAAAVREAAYSTSARRGVVATAVPASRRGRVISVMGMKGGVGKSVLAANIATSLAQAGADVILMDLDLQSGDIGIMLALEPVRTIGDVAAAADRLDAEMLEGFLVRHSSGVRVLLAPAHPDDAEKVTPALIARMIDMARGIAGYVVIDTSATLDSIAQAAAAASDRVLAVTMLDVPSIKDTTQLLARLRALGSANGTVKVVLNRAYSRVFIEDGDVEKTLGAPVYARVPSDRAVPRSVNRGVPIVVEAPRSAVAKSVAELAHLLTGNGV